MYLMPLALLLATGPALPPLTVTGDRTFAASIRGTPMRLRVEPGAASAPVFNMDFAARARLSTSIFGAVIQIGPVELPGWTTTARIDMAGTSFTRRGAWFNRPYISGADAAIGPGGLPMEVIRFQLAAPRPGERTVALPLADFGRAGMGANLVVGDTKIPVRFSLDRDSSVATAAAGAAIADAFSGSFDRPAEKMRLQFGIERPVRHLALARPLALGPLSLDGLMVRTTDFGSTAGIPEAEAEGQDPSEILIIGEKNKSKRLHRLEIGRDQLDRCSSLVFDKRAKTLTLSCR
jgi:hypothetical protein